MSRPRPRTSDEVPGWVRTSDDIGWRVSEGPLASFCILDAWSRQDFFNAFDCSGGTTASRVAALIWPKRGPGRPRKPPQERAVRHQVFLRDGDWERAAEILEQETGATGDNAGKIVAEALRRLVRGEWRPVRE